MMKAYLFLLSMISLYASAQAETIPVSQFGVEGLNGWESENFVGETRYTLVEQNGVTALKAESRGSASALFKKIRIDLDKTPYLNWAWMVEGQLGNFNEREKTGDDYSARVYVIVDGGFFFWKTKALNYVWSSNQAKGSTWPNAYTANARMIAVESGAENLGQWVSEKRNVRDDLRKHFGKALRYIDAVAVMTDTDNTRGAAMASYKTLFFSSE